MSLMTSFRPTTLDQVVGHNHVKKILESKLSKLFKDHPHCFLFAGDSGLGKTTLARIIAKMVNAQVIEFDAGNVTGVDATRELIEEASRISITGKTKKCFIIDEAHMLSKNSWNALLKTIEDPGKHTYFVFCTTELTKVPAAIKNQRALTFKLNPVSSDDIFSLLENIDIEVDEKYNELISRNCEGSPRKALNMLETAIEIDNYEEFKAIVKEGFHEKLEENVLLIAKELIKPIPSIKVLVENIKEVKNYEGARIQIFNYLTAVCMNKPVFIERLVCLSDPIVSNTTGKGDLLIKLIMAKECK